MDDLDEMQSVHDSNELSDESDVKIVDAPTLRPRSSVKKVTTVFGSSFVSDLTTSSSNILAAVKREKRLLKRPRFCVRRIKAPTCRLQCCSILESWGRFDFDVYGAAFVLSPYMHRRVNDLKEPPPRTPGSES